MKNIKKHGKRLLAMVLSLVMCFGLLQTTALAASWNPGDKITINVRVFDQSTGTVYNVGTDSVTKGDQYIQSVTYQIPQLTKFVSASQFGRVIKVAGNWYFPAGDSQPGANVEWSCNASSVTMTYWVTSYSTGSGSGTGSNQNENVSIGSGGNYSWTQYIRYHSNYPDGTDYTYTVAYNIRSYTNMYNTFGNVIKSLAGAGFSVPNGYAAKSPIWNTAKAGTGTGYSEGSNYVFYQSNRNQTLDLYAQWQPTGGTAATPVTLTYMDGSTVYGTRNYFKGDTATAILCTTEKSGYTFAGWDTSSSALEVKYRAGIEFIINSDMTLYAVWTKDSSEPEATEGITVNKVFSGLTVEDIPEDFSIVYKAVNTKEPEYSTTKTLTLDNIKDFNEDTMTATWTAPHYAKTGGSTVTITENASVDGYTYETAASKGTVNNDAHTITLTYSNIVTTATLTITNTYTPATVTPDTPKLTSITKERITSANVSTVPSSISLTGIALDDEPMIAEGEDSVTLLYRISVSGTAEAEYTVSDNGTTLVPGYSWSGKIGENGTANIYVTKSVSLDFASTGAPVENVAHVMPNGETEPGDGLTSNCVITQVYGRLNSHKDGTNTDAQGVSNWDLRISNKTGLALGSVTVTDTMDSRVEFYIESGKPAYEAKLYLEDGTIRDIINCTFDVEGHTAAWEITDVIPLGAEISLTYKTKAPDEVPTGTKLSNTYEAIAEPAMEFATYSANQDILNGWPTFSGSASCTVEVVRDYEEDEA